LAHTHTRNIVGNNPIRAWYYDAIGILVGPQKQSSPEAAKENLVGRLKELNGVFPTAEDLWKPRNGKIIIYDFAMEFIRWIFENKTKKTIPYTQNDIPEENIYDIKRIQEAVKVLYEVSKGVPFEEAFAKVFGFESHQSAYKEFYNSLQEK
jgi:hypothetical protein